jgi:hypothetical protein
MVLRWQNSLFSPMNLPTGMHWDKFSIGCPINTVNAFPVTRLHYFASFGKQVFNGGHFVWQAGGLFFHPRACACCC